MALGAMVGGMLAAGGDPGSSHEVAGRPVRVMLVDDTELVVKGLAAMLAPYHERVEVVGKAFTRPSPRVGAGAPRRLKFFVTGRCDIRALTVTNIRLLASASDQAP